MVHFEIKFPAASPSTIQLEPLPDFFSQRVLVMTEPAMTSACNEKGLVEFWGPLSVQAWGRRQLRSSQIVSCKINNKVAPTSVRAAPVEVDTNPEPWRISVRRSA
jgi:hypothetical protein